MAVIHKNKWLSQSIHKKHNSSQKASKRSGSSPVRQRRRRKKFKSQRRSKNVLKQMTVDYNDFVAQNKRENYQRIQIRPTIEYNCDQRGIQNLDDMEEFDEWTDSQGVWTCSYCHTRNPNESAFCTVCEWQYIRDDTLESYFIYDEPDEQMHAAKSHYSTMRYKKKPQRKHKSTISSCESNEDIYHYNPHLSTSQREMSLDSNGVIYQNYLIHLDYIHSLDRARRKLYNIVSPQIRRLIQSIQTSDGDRYLNHHFVPDKVSVECLLNDFWLRLWMDKFDDITNEIVYVKKTRFSRHRESNKSPMVMDLYRYHPIIKHSKTDRLITFYLTRHDVNAFAPMDVVQICMSYCGLIPQLLPSYNGNFFDYHVHIECDEFISWSRRESTCYKMYLSYSDGWARPFPWFGDEFTICALIGEKMKGQKQQVLNENLLPLFSVRVGKKSEAGNTRWEAKRFASRKKCSSHPARYFHPRRWSFGWGYKVVSGTYTERHNTKFKWIGVNERDHKKFALTD